MESIPRSVFGDEPFRIRYDIVTLIWRERDCHWFARVMCFGFMKHGCGPGVPEKYKPIHVDADDPVPEATYIHCHDVRPVPDGGAFVLFPCV